jgi:hypothetical protein
VIFILFSNIFSRAGVTKDAVRIGNWIYWILNRS